ncbi:MAG: hypothetical protein AAGM21_05990 [Pseudomonadota bacterium]
MTSRNTFDDIDIVKVRRDAEAMRTEMLRTMFADFRKRISGTR